MTKNIMTAVKSRVTTKAVERGCKKPRFFRFLQKKLRSPNCRFL